MDEDNPGKKHVSDEVAKGGEVMRAVEEVVEGSLRDVDDAVASSERNLKEAEELYEETEGGEPSDED